MGEPVKIYDMANKLIKLSGLEPGVDVQIKITGLRPGEKLYEEILMEEEGLTETKHDKIHIAKPSNVDIKMIVEKLNKLRKLVETNNNENLSEIKRQCMMLFLLIMQKNRRKGSNIHGKKNFFIIT